MITYRLQTQPPTTQTSLKFYRAIALSFLAITILLLGIVIFITSKKAEIVIVAKEDNKKVNLTVEISPNPKQGKLTVPGTVTTTIFTYTATFSPTGNKTSDAIATGEVTIYNKGNEDQTLIKTTRLLNQDNILFRLMDRVTVPARGEIKAKIYADQPGGGGNIGLSKFSIPGLNSEKQKVVYAESNTPMTGGVKQVGILRQEDIEAAKINYKNKVKETFLANLPNKEQTIINVEPKNLICDKNPGDEVSEFEISGSSDISIISYDQEMLAELINREINNKIDTSLEKVLSVNNNPTILPTAVNDTETELSVTQDVVVTIDANSDKLSSQFFAGKKKDDVEKYLLGLDHVSTATINITPGWSNSIPSSPDKIKVIVKNVQ